MGTSWFPPSYCFPSLTLTRWHSGPMSAVPPLQHVHLHPRRSTRHRVGIHSIAAAVASAARRRRRRTGGRGLSSRRRDERRSGTVAHRDGPGSGAVLLLQ